MYENTEWILGAIIEKIMSIIKTEIFWNIIDEHIDEGERFEINKPFNLLVLANKLKNTFISVLAKDCQKNWLANV